MAGMPGMDFELSLPMIGLPSKETEEASFIGLKPVSCVWIYKPHIFLYDSSSADVMGRILILSILK